MHMIEPASEDDRLGTALDERPRERRDTAGGEVYALLERVSQGVVLMDSGGRVLYCNDRFATMIGLPAFVFLGITLDDYFSPRGALRFRALQRGDREDQRAGAFTLRRFDCAAVPANVSVMSLSASAPGAARYGALFTDLRAGRRSDGKIAEQAEQLVHEIQRRKGAEERLDRVLRSGGAASWECDLASGRATHGVGMNRVFGGIATTRWSVRNIVDAFDPFDREAIALAFASVEKTGSIDIEGWVSTAGATTRRVRLEGRLVPGTPLRLAGCARDVTPSRVAGDRPAHAEPIAATRPVAVRTPHDPCRVSSSVGKARAGLARKTADAAHVDDAGQSALLCAAQLSHQWLTSLRGLSGGCG